MENNNKVPFELRLGIFRLKTEASFGQAVVWYFLLAILMVTILIIIKDHWPTTLPGQNTKQIIGTIACDSSRAP